MDLGTVAIVALISGFIGGAVGAALVGTLETILRRRIEKTVPDRAWTIRHTYVRKERPES